MTQCNRCGDCCERIWTEWTRASLNYKIAKYPPAAPLDYSLPPEALNAQFTNKHWHNIEDDPHRWTCDAFDPVGRLCTAHDARPPVCSGFPWYQDEYGGAGAEEPNAEHLRRYPRCAFWADLPSNAAPVAVAIEMGVR